MKNNLERQKFTCKIIFPDDLPLTVRRKFVRDSKRLGYHDGNKAQDKEIHLVFDNPIQRQIMHTVAGTKGFQVINTN
jgi:hypothetical protein